MAVWVFPITSILCSLKIVISYHHIKPSSIIFNEFDNLLESLPEVQYFEHQMSTKTLCFIKGWLTFVRRFSIKRQPMDASEQNYIKLTTAPVKGLICSFALPSIICMLTTSIYNMADTYFVSRLNTQSIAAVGIVFSYMGIIQAVSFFFGHGSGNYISRELGARRVSNAETMASTGLFSALISGILIAILCLLFEKPILRLFGSTDSIMPYASEYFHYILAGTPFIAGSIVLNNQMRLQGNARLSMIGILSGGFINVLLDPIFIFKFRMGVAGAGLATAVSQMICFLFMLNLSGQGGGIRIKLGKFVPSKANFLEIAAGGLPSLARQGLTFVSLICLNNLASGYGDATVASFSVASRVIAIASALLIGFGQGFQPVCGFNYGAGKFDRLRTALKFTVSVGTVYCISFAFIAFIFASKIISVFCGGDVELLETGSQVLRFHCLSFPLCGLIIISNMFLQNIRKTGPAVLVASARQGLFFIPAVLIGNLVAGEMGLVAAQPISDLCAFLLCIPLFNKAYRELK